MGARGATPKQMGQDATRGNKAPASWTRVIARGRGSDARLGETAPRAAGPTPKRLVPQDHVQILRPLASASEKD